ncbi:MAG: phosphoribosylglycinamide formyltransferase [Verrucomicrobiota bacterium]
MNLGFFASHGGSNFQALAEACQDGRIPAHAAVLISNNSHAPVLDRARTLGIPCHHLCVGAQIPDLTSLDRACLEALQRHAVDFVVLCGYMKKIGPQVLRAYRGRMINTHPALLPKFGGQGMYGRNVHAAVLDAHEQETGVTVHLVTEEYDAGSILTQTRVAVNPDDTPESLAARVLEREHIFLVETVGQIARGQLRLP